MVARPPERVLFPRRLSSEDGEEAAAYSYESDDSVETRGKTLYSGEMDLLGEILDTLSTHSSDPGKLAAAKSLDFFRSMDNIDYQPAVSGAPATEFKAPSLPRLRWPQAVLLAHTSVGPLMGTCPNFKNTVTLNHEELILVKTNIQCFPFYSANSGSGCQELKFFGQATALSDNLILSLSFLGTFIKHEMSPLYFLKFLDLKID